ncbi:Hypothetical protein NGK_0864 [Neisseria gonorrhoeae NCCP11945]|uniref:Uncharacterized protein n=1 Tax=Neisseria gonorrhoeae (strain NCCP11945) TaxID=521006 RepID=B4RL54_NEIG2|nr:Hypothetical protein NGK_0864 [Neisseria gonorrhoeae NCCP11945]
MKTLSAITGFSVLLTTVRLKNETAGFQTAFSILETIE